MNHGNKNIAKNLKGIAGVHFVISQLSLRGLIALPTIRNTEGIDVLVSEPNGNYQASLQVKTNFYSRNYWPTSKPDKCLKGKNTFYVFLRYLEKEKRFEAFLETGDEVYKQVKENLDNDIKAGRSKNFCYWWLPDDQEKIRKLQKNWDTWRP